MLLILKYFVNLFCPFLFKKAVGANVVNLLSYLASSMNGQSVGELCVHVPVDDRGSPNTVIKRASLGRAVRATLTSYGIFCTLEKYVLHT